MGEGEGFQLILPHARTPLPFFYCYCFSSLIMDITKTTAVLSIQLNIAEDPSSSESRYTYLYCEIRRLLVEIKNLYKK